MDSVPIRRLGFVPALLAELLAILLTALSTACLRVPPAPLSAGDGAHRIEARSLADPALRAFLSERLARPIETGALCRLGVEELTLVAIYFNPTLRVAEASFEVARAHEKTAAQRPNPNLQIQPLYAANNVASGMPPWISVFTLNWTIETGGKYAARRSVAEASTRVAEANQLETAWQIRGSVTQAAIGLHAAKRRMDRRARILDQLAHRSALLERRLAFGAASQKDLTPARQARLQAEALYATSARAEAEARARLASTLGLPRAALEGVLLADDLDAAPARWTQVAALDSETARHTAMSGRSDVLAGLADYDAAEANLRLQLAQQYPNVVIGPSYKFDEGGHRYGFTLALDLPLLNRNAGAIEEAVAARSLAAARFEALQTRVLAEVDGATASLAGAREEYARVDEVVRGADREDELAARSLAEGATDRATYLAATVARDEIELAAIDASERLQLALARLELAVRPLGPIDLVVGTSTQP